MLLLCKLQPSLFCDVYFQIQMFVHQVHRWEMGVPLLTEAAL